MAILVFAPAVIWSHWNNSVSGERELSAGDRFVLTAVGTPDAPGTGTVVVTVPDDDGWTTDTGNNRASRIDLVHGPAVVEVTAVAGVNDMSVLFDRQRRDQSNADPAMFTTGKRSYESPTGLTGYAGNMTGERYSGVLIVVGRGAVAAVVVAYAPLGRLDGETKAIEQILATLEVS